MESSTFDYHNNKIIRRIIWEKTTPIKGLDKNTWGIDANGKRIKWSSYGKSDDKYGWDVDHEIPESKGGKTVKDNLQPLNIHYNRSIGNDTKGKDMIDKQKK